MEWAYCSQFCIVTMKELINNQKRAVKNINLDNRRKAIENKQWEDSNETAIVDEVWNNFLQFEWHANTLHTAHHPSNLGSDAYRHLHTVMLQSLDTSKIVQFADFRFVAQPRVQGNRTAENINIFRNDWRVRKTSRVNSITTVFTPCCRSLAMFSHNACFLVRSQVTSTVPHASLWPLWASL